MDWRKEGGRRSVRCQLEDESARLFFVERMRHLNECSLRAKKKERKKVRRRDNHEVRVETLCVRERNLASPALVGLFRWHGDEARDTVVGCEKGAERRFRAPTRVQSASDFEGGDGWGGLRMYRGDGVWVKLFSLPRTHQQRLASGRFGVDLRGVEEWTFVEWTFVRGVVLRGVVLRGVDLRGVIFGVFFHFSGITKTNNLHAKD